MNKARARFISSFIVSVMRVRTVNLTQIALNFSATTKASSSYRRIQDFFVKFNMNFHLLARLIMSLLPKEPLVLSIDRTNWKFGKADINIFMLTAEYHGVAVPILWHMLAKRGNSNQLERIALIEEFVSLFGKGRISNLLADREFIGEQWVGYLHRNQIPYTIRVKHNMLVEPKEGRDRAQHLSGLFQRKQACSYPSEKLFGVELNIAGKKLGNGDYMIIVTNGDAMANLEEYRRRWKIETMFSCLKTRGFNLEDTHMICPDKLKMLVGLLALCFLFCLVTGVEKNNRQAIAIKKHGRKAVSIFRYGLDHLRKLICDIGQCFQRLDWELDKIIQEMSTITLVIRRN